MNSVYQTFCDSAAQYPDQDFLHIPLQACGHYSDSSIDLSYRQAGAGIEQLKSLYQRAGFGSGHRVALLLQNRAEFLLHWLALNALGTTVVPINDEMAAEEQAYIINHSEASLLLYLPDLADKLKALKPLLGEHMVYQDTDQMEGLCPPTEPASGEPSTLHSECAVLYTSGSTGKPKGCLLSNDYFTRFGNWYQNLGGLAGIRQGEERLLTPLPLGHMNAMAVSTLAMIMSAGCIIQLDRFHPRSWWQTIRDSRATIVHYLGVLPAILLELPAGDDDFSQQIRFGFGAGVNPGHHARFEERFGFPLLEAWAMTESGCGGCIIANHESRHVGNCCFGIPAPQVEYQLVDESKQQVGRGEDGELRVRAAGEDPRRGFFSGYLKNPETTAEAWQDGWLNTGDVVREGEDGSLYFVDRRKNVIRRSGENISALEVETSLSADPVISEVLVTSIPDDLRGDEVAACIVLNSESKPAEQLAQDIVSRCRAHLAYYKVPGYIVFCEELPMTASNKPRRADVKALARLRVESGECFDLRHLKKRTLPG